MIIELWTQSIEHGIIHWDFVKKWTKRSKEVVGLKIKNGLFPQLRKKNYINTVPNWDGWLLKFIRAFEKWTNELNNGMPSAIEQKKQR